MRARVARKISDQRDRREGILKGTCRDWIHVEHVKYTASAHARALKPVTMPRIIIMVERFLFRSSFIFSLHNGLDELTGEQKGICSKISFGTFVC